MLSEMTEVLSSETGVMRRHPRQQLAAEFPRQRAQPCKGPAADWAGGKRLLGKEGQEAGRGWQGQPWVHL